MAKLPLRFINISEVQHQILELQDENQQLKQRLKDMEELLNGIKKEVDKGSETETLFPSK